MKIKVPEGFKELPVPDRLRNLVPAKFGVEMYEATPDFGDGKFFAITYGRTEAEFLHTQAMLSDKIFWASDRAIRSTIINALVLAMNHKILLRSRRAGAPENPGATAAV